MPMRTGTERTRAGCWTCRARRKKCDERRPHCTTCTRLGLACDGYAVRLRWQTPPRTSDVRSSNSPEAGLTAVVPSAKGKEKESPEGGGGNGDGEGDEGLMYFTGARVYASLTVREKELLRDFVKWGAAQLISSITTGRQKYFQILAHSKALLASCLASQAMLDARHAKLADLYYIRTIEEFRRELSDPACVDQDATVYAGLLLCSVSMMRGLPWTMHLNGIASIIGARNSFLDQFGQPKAHVAYFGILDLPTHTLGRKTENLHIWSRFCRGQDGLDDCLGLPCSLIDLLCCVHQPGIQERLLSWDIPTGSEREVVQWDLVRHGGVIMAYEFAPSISLGKVTSKTHDVQVSIESSVRNIVSTVDMLKVKHRVFSSTTWSNLLFPLVAAGSQFGHLSTSDKELVVRSVSDLADASIENNPYISKILLVLRELWDKGEGRSIQKVARDLDIELGLF